MYTGCYVVVVVVVVVVVLLCRNIGNILVMHGWLF